MSNEFNNRNYECNCSNRSRELSVTKRNGVWFTIKHEIHNRGDENTKIDIRGRQAAEQLYFMLGQMLGISED